MAIILMVDDEEMDRALGRDMLESQGHEIIYAGNGEVALARCRDSHVDLVITDLAMPDFNGLRFIMELREEGFDLPIIAVSGLAADQLDLAEDYGADATLVKPLDGEELRNLVARLLDPPGPSTGYDPWRRGR